MTDLQGVWMRDPRLVTERVRQAGPAVALAHKPGKRQAAGGAISEVLMFHLDSLRERERDRARETARRGGI